MTLFTHQCIAFIKALQSERERESHTRTRQQPRNKGQASSVPNTPPHVSRKLLTGF
jgi:hypothetical protein